MLGLGDREIGRLEKEADDARVDRDQSQYLARLAQREMVDKLFRNVISPTDSSPRIDGRK
jgi:hypothetical protein